MLDLDRHYCSGHGSTGVSGQYTPPKNSRDGEGAKYEILTSKFDNRIIIEINYTVNIAISVKISKWEGI